MKNGLIGIAITLALTGSMAHASTNPADQSAVLNISGQVYGASAGCDVILSKSSINISADQSSIPWYTDTIHNVNNSGVVDISLNTSDSTCKQLVDENRIAYTLDGAQDPNGSGLVLLNTDTSSTGAKGIGIGIYNAFTLAPIHIGEKVTPDSNSAARIYMGLVSDNGAKTPGNVTSSLTVNVIRL